MSSLTKKYTDEEMNAALGALLMGGERLETAVYCIFKPTGFFESNRNIVAGYAGITSSGRLLCCKYGIINEQNTAYNMENIVRVKIRPIILGQKIVTIDFDGGRKYTLKLQLAPKVAGSKLPNQERNTKKCLRFWRLCRIKCEGAKMSDIVFKKAGMSDIASLVELRTAYLIEDYGGVPREKFDIEKITEKLPDYFRRHLNRDCFVYTAEFENETVSCCFLTVYEKPSNPSFINGFVGTVMNVYTKPEYRRRGIAGRLLKMLLDDAEKMGLDFVELKATDSGYDLYKSLGFKDTVSKYHNMKIEF